MEWRRHYDAVYWFDLTSAQDKGLVLAVDCVQCHNAQRLHAFRLLGQSGPQDERDPCTTRPSLSRKSIQRPHSDPILPEISQPSPVTPQTQTRFSQWVEYGRIDHNCPT